MLVDGSNQFKNARATIEALKGIVQKGFTHLCYRDSTWGLVVDDLETKEVVVSEFEPRNKRISYLDANSRGQDTTNISTEANGYCIPWM